MQTFSKARVNKHKRADLSREVDPGARAALVGQLTPNDILGTFDYTLIPGLLTPIGIPELATEREQVLQNNKSSRGIWLIRRPEELNIDENGWVAIHWPTYIKHVVTHHDTFAYLRNKGCSVRGLQKASLLDLEGAVEAIDSYKAILSQALPPGCLLEADTPFFRRIVGMFVEPEDYALYVRSPIDAFMRPWTFFRWGALANRVNSHGAVGRFSHLLKRYNATRSLLISKAIRNAPEGTPKMVLVLLTALERARHCDGAAWPLWGIAWLKDGLAFNYRQAVKSIKLDRKLCYSLFGHLEEDENTGTVEDPAAEWLDPAYVLHKPPGGLPRIGSISWNSAQGGAYIRKATAPYAILFQGTTPDIEARHLDHDTDFQIFFPIAGGRGKGVCDILSYIDYLADYDNVHNVHIQLNTHRTPQAKLRPDVKPKSSKLPDRTTYIVGFNGYNLGCTLPQPTELPVYPFNMGMVEYKGEYYFSIPDNLREAYPELDNEFFYTRSITCATVIWRPGEVVAWDAFVFDKAPKTPRAYDSNHFAEVTLHHMDTGKRPLFHNARGTRYFHPAVFRLDGEMDTVIAAILENRPEANPDHANLLTTFQTLWHWVYDIRNVIKMGKVSEEFMYNVGFGTTHCPEKRKLNSTAKRLQYIIDKALHSRDERVCDLTPGHDRSAPRSKQLNSYDDFALWYAANHEIALLPLKLDALQQAEYICKRWLPWRRPPGLVAHLVKPHKEGTKTFATNQMPQLLAHAQKEFGPSFTEY